MSVSYLGQGPHQGVGLPRAGLPEGKDGAGEAAEDAERWAQVAQRCHLPTQPRQCKRAGKARPGGDGGLGSAGGSPGSPVYGQLHQPPHPAAFEHSLLRGAGVEHGAEAEGGIVPGRADLPVGTVPAQGGRSPPQPRHPDGEVALTWTAPSPRLCTTRWSPRRVSVQVSGRTLMVGCARGHRGGAAWGLWGALR